MRSTTPSCRFDPPLEAALGNVPAQLFELSRDRASLQIGVALAPGKRSHLSFRAGGDLFRITVDVLSCRVERDASLARGRLVHSSEIRLAEMPHETCASLSQLVQVLGTDQEPAQTEALQFEIVGF